MNTLTQVPCPSCKKMSPWQGNAFRPFCSERCKLIDLGAWASEKFAVPTHEYDESQAVDTDKAADEKEEEPE